MDRTVPTEVVAQLTALFRRNGYVRWQNEARRAAEGYLKYKKGDEVRLVADSPEELEEIQRLLQAAGFKLGQPFAKACQFRQPIYGRAQVARFLEMVGETGSES